MNDFDRRYIKKLLALHTDMGLDSQDPPETRIWHILRSLIEYCDAQTPRLALDTILEDVRHDFKTNT